MASSTNLAGLNMTISMMKFDVILLQEVKMTQVQLDSAIRRHGFLASVNISEDDINKPGTAILWRETIPVTGIVNLIECRLQIAELGPYRIMNCYAPSGSENRFQRNIFWGRICSNI